MVVVVNCWYTEFAVVGSEDIHHVLGRTTAVAVQVDMMNYNTNEKVGNDGNSHHDS